MHLRVRVGGKLEEAIKYFVEIGNARSPRHFRDVVERLAPVIPHAGIWVRK